MYPSLCVNTFSVHLRSYVVLRIKKKNFVTVETYLFFIFWKNILQSAISIQTLILNYLNLLSFDNHIIY